jgi:hypothetical protein
MLRRREKEIPFGRGGGVRFNRGETRVPFDGGDPSEVRASRSEKKWYEDAQFKMYLLY